MANPPEQERILPSLLDRLTDDDPGNQKPDPRARRGQSLQALRNSVGRDLSWLLNSGNLEATTDLEPYPLVARSVLNYGIPDLAGTTASSLDLPAIEQLLRDAIRDFEPRLISETIKVRLSVDEGRMCPSAVNFDIEGELRADPVPVRIYLKAEIDLESGSVDLADGTGREAG